MPLLKLIYQVFFKNFINKIEIDSYLRNATQLHQFISIIPKEKIDPNASCSSIYKTVDGRKPKSPDKSKPKNPDKWLEKLLKINIKSKENKSSLNLPLLISTGKTPRNEKTEHAKTTKNLKPKVNFTSLKVQIPEDYEKLFENTFALRKNYMIPLSIHRMREEADLNNGRKVVKQEKLEYLLSQKLKDIVPKTKRVAESQKNLPTIKEKNKSSRVSPVPNKKIHYAKLIVKKPIIRNIKSRKDSALVKEISIKKEEKMSEPVKFFNYGNKL